MIKLDFDYLGKIAQEHGLSSVDFEGGHQEIAVLISQIEKRGQGFYKVIDDEDLVREIVDYAESVRQKYDDVVVLGIGGSSLGPICIQQSLRNLYGIPAKGWPRLHVLDNIDAVFISELEEQINLKRTLFLVITKSGGTPETLAQFLYFKDKIEKAKAKIEDHFIFVTDAEKGLLRSLAGQNPAIKTFEIPANVGGRFSVLTAVGLLPAALMGVDIEKMLVGARAMRDKFLSVNLSENVCYKLALTQYLLYQKGKIMTVTFPYAQKLIRFSDWYRQLLAESIGKAVDDKGMRVNVGITPVHAVGVTDQHSQNQLYNEGPNDKMFIFIEVLKAGLDLEIPFDEDLAKELGYLKGVSFDKLLRTEMEGTLQSLVKVDRPCLRLSVEQIDEYVLGELFMLFEGATAFLGELFGINAYDQPGVELSKKLTKELLSK